MGGRATVYLCISLWLSLSFPIPTIFTLNYHCCNLSSPIQYSKSCFPGLGLTSLLSFRYSLTDTNLPWCPWKDVAWPPSTCHYGIKQKYYFSNFTNSSSIYRPWCQPYHCHNVLIRNQCHIAIQDITPRLLFLFWFPHPYPGLPSTQLFLSSQVPFLGVKFEIAFFQTTSLAKCKPLKPNSVLSSYSNV